MVLLGQLLRAREIAREKIAKMDLVKDEGVKSALRLQGQIAGIDLCIDEIFDLANVGYGDEDANGQ